MFFFFPDNNLGYRVNNHGLQPLITQNCIVHELFFFFCLSSLSEWQFMTSSCPNNCSGFKCLLQKESIKFLPKWHFILLEVVLVWIQYKMKFLQAKISFSISNCKKKKRAVALCLVVLALLLKVFCFLLLQNLPYATRGRWVKKNPRTFKKKKTRPYFSDYLS